MATAYIKKLVHGYGAEVAIWHPTANVYCLVRCDDDCPPDPMWLDLNFNDDPYIEPETLRWEITGEAYDSETGEPA